VSRHVPLHVTLRMVRRLPSLRSEAILAELRRVLAKGRERLGMRVVHYSIQDDHMHLVVEAADRRALSRGMRGLDVRLARGVNRAIGRHGSVLGERYHARALRTPREVRSALAYVLLNWRKHTRSGRVAWDLASSGPVFEGWQGADPGDRLGPEIIGEIARTRAPPHGWLLGWRRAGLVDPEEVPGSFRGPRPPRRRA
jgi:REP element-mobilizing transposase RayT